MTMSWPTNWRDTLFVVVVIASLSPGANAHGPAPSPLQVLAADATGPSVVGTSIGLARRTPEGFAYVCPSAWNAGEDAFDRPIPVAATIGDVVVVLGRPHIMRSEQRGCEMAPVTGPLEGRGADALDVATISESGSPSFALLVDDGLEGTSVWTAGALEAPAQLLEPVVPLQSLGRNAGRIVAAGVDRREEERTLTLVSGPSAGPLVVTRLLPDALPEGAASLSSVRVRLVDEGDIWLVVATSDGFHLWRAFEDEDAGYLVEEVAQSEGAVHGPIPLCGTVAFATEGELQFVDAEDATCDAQAVGDLEIRCLGQEAGLAYACASFQLFSLDNDDGNLGAAPFFAMSDLSGPDLSCLDSDVERDRCTSVWTHFGAEAGLQTPEPSPTPEGEPESEPKSCACVRAPALSNLSSTLALLFCGLAFARRRTRDAR